MKMGRACVTLVLAGIALGVSGHGAQAATGEPEAGMWELSADMAVPSTPGFKQDPVALRQCISAAAARDPAGLLTEISYPGASNCSFTDKRETPGHTDFAVRCEGLLSISGKGSVDYTSSTMQGRLNFSFSSGIAGDTQRVEAVSRVTGKRIGGC